ncbi:MAG: redoxin domain-containing protein, partial [Chitinophaga rupis]
FIDKGPIGIVTHGQLEGSTVTGSAADVASREANRRIRAAFDAEKTLGALYRETEDQLIFNEVADIIMGLDPIEKTDYITYIHSHPNTAIGAWLLNELLSLHQSSGFIDTLQQLYSLLPENIRGSMAGKRVAAHLERELRSAIGHPAPDFTLPDTSGAAIHLRSFRGKYVLVHFWQTEDNASNMFSTLAYLSKAYKDYKDKGLVVIGVGMDTDKEKWLHSIHEMKLNWPQVNDLGGWPGPAPQAFGIHTNNRNVLIDPNGVIIARDLSLTEVDRHLAPIFE